jgi:hypothetical protein
VKSTSPLVTFTFSCPASQGNVCGGVFSGDPDAAADRINGTYTPPTGAAAAVSTSRVP